MASVFYNATSVATIPTRWASPTTPQLVAGWTPPSGFVITGLFYRGTDRNLTVEVREVNPLVAEADREIFQVPVVNDTLTPVLGEWVRYDEADLNNEVIVALARGT